MSKKERDLYVYSSNSTVSNENAVSLTDVKEPSESFQNNDDMNSYSIETATVKEEIDIKSESSIEALEPSRQDSGVKIEIDEIDLKKKLSDEIEEGQEGDPLKVKIECESPYSFEFESSLNSNTMDKCSNEAVQVKEEIEMKYEVCDEVLEPSWQESKIKIEIDETDLKEERWNELDRGYEENPLKVKAEDFENVPFQLTEEVFIKDEENLEFIQKEHLEVAEKHLNQNHSGAKILECRICKESFSVRTEMEKHYYIHPGEFPYKCEICQTHFVYQTSFKKHMLIHADIRDHKCEFCEKSFRRAFDLKNHILIHTGEKPYKCDICKKLFRIKAHLKLHMSIHADEKPYKCDICGKSLYRQRSFKNHMLSHTIEKNNKCDICDKLFKRKSCFEKHMLNHTRGIIRTPRIKCNICEKRFNHKNTFKVHMLIHTGEKPHKCDICGRLFRSKSTLKTHILTHTTEKLHKCDICDTSYRQKRGLKRHMLIHTGHETT